MYYLIPILDHFILKFFHNAIAFNDFIFKINRILLIVYSVRNSLKILFIFCESDAVKSIWNDFVQIIRYKYDIDFCISHTFFF